MRSLRSQKEGVGRVSESSMSMPVDLKLDASLDYILVRDYRLMKIELEGEEIRRGVELPLILVRVSPDVRSPEVGSVYLEDFSVDLDVEGAPQYYEPPSTYPLRRSLRHPPYTHYSGGSYPRGRHSL